MKITTFDPLIVSSRQADAIKVFEELGFAVTHSPVTTVETGDVNTVRMKNESGFHIDIAESHKEEPDVMEIRMNVDNFEEAYEILKAHGFHNTRGDNTLDLQTATAATMVAPSGFKIALVKHIK